MNDLTLLLLGWGDFFRMTAEAAGALIGLLFVVVTLAAERLENVAVDAGKMHREIGTYLTPTVIFFVSVLLADCLLVFPHHTPLSATLCMCLGGVLALGYTGSMLVRGKKGYIEQQDLITYGGIPFPAYVIIYAGIPFTAYGLLTLGGVLLLYDAQLGLTLVAVSLLALLTLGIRNSWAIATQVASIRSLPHQKPDA